MSAITIHEDACPASLHSVQVPSAAKSSSCHCAKARTQVKKAPCAVALELTNSTHSSITMVGRLFVPPPEFFYLGILDSVFEDSVFSRSELSKSNYHYLFPSTSSLVDEVET